MPYVHLSFIDMLFVSCLAALRNLHGISPAKFLVIVLHERLTGKITGLAGEIPVKLAAGVSLHRYRSPVRGRQLLQQRPYLLKREGRS